MLPLLTPATASGLPLALTAPFGLPLASAAVTAGAALLVLAAAAFAVISILRWRARATALAREHAELSRRLHAQTAETAGAVEQRQKETAAREQAETALRNERGFVDQFLKSVPDAIYFKDTQSRFVRCSDSEARLLGQTRAADVIGKTDFDFFSAEHAQPAFDDEKRVMETGRPIIGLL